MGSLYRSRHELIFVFKSGAAPHINNVELGRHGRYRTNVWEYRTHIRKAGEALHPARDSLESLEITRRTAGEYNFAGQYQQNPVPLGGGMIKEAWFETYLPDALPTSGYQIVQSWDTASKESELTDYSVCTTWLAHNNRVFLIDVYRQRLEFPALKRAVRQKAEEFKPSTILIEDKASGIQLIQELKYEGLHMVRGVKPEGDKVMRLLAQTASIENGLVHLPQEAAWLRDYVAEMTSFPKAKFDDQVDSTSQALAWIKSGLWGPGMGMFHYMREQYERRQREGN